MPLRNLPIRRKLMVMLLVTSGAVLAVTCAAFIGYQYHNYRAAARHTVQTLGEVIASNSTAASLSTMRRTRRTCSRRCMRSGASPPPRYMTPSGALFAHYPADAPASAFPPHPKRDGLRFDAGLLIDYQPIRQGGNTRLGTLYLRWDLAALHQEIALYALDRGGIDRVRDAARVFSRARAATADLAARADAWTRGTRGL